MKKRFGISTLLGLAFSLALLCFAFILFQTLYKQDELSFTNLFASLDTRIIELLRFTIFQAFLSTFLSLTVGLILAWALTHQNKFKGRNFLIALFSSSLVLPTLIVVFGLIGIFGRYGYINQISEALFGTTFGSYLYGLSGILLAHIYLNASFSLRALLHSFETIPKDKYKLAKSLNFGIFRRFLYVEFPALKTTLLSIGATIFLLCFTSFAIVLLLGGNPSFNTLEVAIYEAVKLDFDIPLALKLSLIQLIICAILVILSNSFRINTNNLKVSENPLSQKDSKIIQTLQWIIIVFLTLFFVTPLIVIFIDGLKADFNSIFSNTTFQKAFLFSLLLAISSSIFTVFIALIFSFSKRDFSLKTRLANKPIATFLNSLLSFCSNIYLAIPSLVLGLGFFLMYQQSDSSILLWSTIAILSANILMSLPFAINILSPVVNKVSKRYDKLSLSLGITPLTRWRNIEYPYLKSSLAYVFVLSFCFSLGDLGVIALFGSEDFITLPWYLYQLMCSYNTNDAAGVALILLVLVLGVFILIPYLFRSSNVKN